MNDIEIGRLGENLAANFLIKKGMILLQKNYLIKKVGEIDLLMRDGEEIVLVEVKSGVCSGAMGGELFRPLDRVNYKKQMKLRLLANCIAGQYPDSVVRVDVVEVKLDLEKRTGRCMHLENVIEG